MRVRSVNFILTGALGGAVGFLLMELTRWLLEMFSGRAPAQSDGTHSALQFAAYGLAVGAGLGSTQGLFQGHPEMLRRGLLLGAILGILGGFAGGLVGEWIYDAVPTRYVVESRTDLAVVLDSSGSMGFFRGTNDPWGRRRKAARRLAERLSAQVRLTVIDFDHEARVALPLTLLGDQGARKRAVAAIATIDSSGGTNLGAGMAAALDQLQAHRQSDRPQSAIFLTDGEGDYDPALTTAAANAGVTIYTVGLGSGIDQRVLEQIAAGTGGAFFPVSRAKDLIDLFQTIATQHNNMLAEVGGDAGTPGRQTTSPILLWGARTLAWAAMGWFLGLGQGIRENSWQDVGACSRGGALGGLLGGALFDPTTQAIAGTLGALAARGAGTVLVGGLIGGSMRILQAVAESRMAQRGERRSPIVSGLRIGSQARSDQAHDAKSERNPLDARSFGRKPSGPR